MKPCKTSLWLSLLTCLLTPVPARAHDPGLSAAELKLEGVRLAAQVSFNHTDIEPAVRVDADGDGNVSGEEFDAARPRLEAAARDALAVEYDGERIAPDQVSVRIDETASVHFSLGFPGAPDFKLSVRSLILDKFARGNRQYFVLRDANQKLLAERVLDAANNAVEIGAGELAAAHTAWHTFRQFLVLGVEHILTGYDHLLFLIALLIASLTFGSVVKIVTSFTVAHSITLALAALDLVALPAAVVEPVIALSIIYVGVENILYRDRPERLEQRWLLTFAFGLIHGFGFAGVLRELEIGSGGGGIAVPLVAFNLGVELGQLAIALLVWPLVWKLRARPLVKTRYVAACSLVVALAGAYWLVERTLLK
jgi:hydrogenase/urease accessory protein HupE